MRAADIHPVAASEQTQSPLDLFVIFAGANLVATTFQVGASLAASFTMATTSVLVVLGSAGGAALVALLAPVGSRLRVPSVIAARAALGVQGAAVVAIVLYASNFAWIALNNVIAASACAGLGLGSSPPAWAIALGLVATLVVWRGPRAVARADRLAVPLMIAVGVALTVACARAPRVSRAPAGSLGWWRGLDVVIAYQVSWILMFADYSRYTRSARGSVVAVFLGLALTSLWMMPLGALAAGAAGTGDPGAMLAAVGLGAAGAVLLAVATVTTNFVNIYISALAWKSLVPRASDTAVVWSTGLAGAALSAIPGVWIEQYSRFMVALGTILVPVGGVLVAHFYSVRPLRLTPDADPAALYDAAGPLRGVRMAGVVAWGAGALAYFAAGTGVIDIGGTIPALVVSSVVYVSWRTASGDGHA